MISNDRWYAGDRLGGLRRFAVAITLLNLLGHFFFGFEQSWAQPLAALAAAYTMEIVLEVVDARSNRRPVRFSSKPRALVDFLLSAHITALAVSMLLYANQRIAPIVFATAVAIGSKAIFRIAVGQSSRHVFNPSNFGITVTLLLFPWVGIAPPYHFVENLSGIGDWLLPAVIVVSGSFLNTRFTHRLPLIVAWLGGFLAQAVGRSFFLETPLIPALLPMTGMAFILYTFYMVTDPGTTPTTSRGQVTFGLSVAGVYSLLMISHIVFGLFFALTLVCALRGLILSVQALLTQGAFAPEKLPVPVPAVGKEI